MGLNAGLHPPSFMAFIFKLKGLINFALLKSDPCCSSKTIFPNFHFELNYEDTNANLFPTQCTKYKLKKFCFRIGTKEIDP